MTTGHVFIATSLDGFIARTDHQIDWLTENSAGTEEHGYTQFIDSVDGIVMGRNTGSKLRQFTDRQIKFPPNSC